MLTPQKNLSKLIHDPYSREPFQALLCVYLWVKLGDLRKSANLIILLCQCFQTLRGLIVHM